MYAAWRNFLEKCETLFNQLQECKVDILKEDEKNDLMEFPLPTLAFDDIAKSDDQINVLLAEVLLKPFPLLFAFHI